MNYRHAFHAGNFADVLKHIILVRILVHLRGKPAPFRVIDVHAGAGLYDLSGPEAARTGEWRDGIGRLAAAPLPPPAAELVAPYRDVVWAVNASPGLRYYPGSPLIAARLLRPRDRLTASDIEPDVAGALAGHLRAQAVAPLPAMEAATGSAALTPPDGDETPRGTGRRIGSQAKVFSIDGSVALNANVPPKERRGLVIIDPPYERADDFLHLAEAVGSAYRKWPTGIFMMWYPIKGGPEPDRLASALRRAAIRKALRIELAVGSPGLTAASGMTSCGVIAINPPWTLAAELAIILPALTDCLARGEGRFDVRDLGAPGLTARLSKTR